MTVALFINIDDASYYERNIERFAQVEAVEKQVSLHKILRTSAIAQSLKWLDMGWKQSFNEQQEALFLHALLSRQLA